MDTIVRREAQIREPWNKGKVIGAKPPLRPKHVWAVRTRLQLSDRFRDLAPFNVAIDSKLRGCDVVSLKVVEVMRSIEHPFGSAKREDRFASRSRSKRARPSTTICPNVVKRPVYISSLDVARQAI
jgi:hypothetical protein